MKRLPATAVFLLCLGVAAVGWADDNSDAWRKAQRRGEIYSECGSNISRLLQGWIDLQRDAKTHLYTRGNTWDYHDAAADHYSSLVLMAHFVAPHHNRPGGTLHQTMVNSRRLCASPDGIPTVYKPAAGKQGRQATLSELSEWLRDGLIRIVELTGTDNVVWYDEMIRLTDAMLAKAKKGGGAFKSFNKGSEMPGNMLQTLARLYVMSGNEKYLLAAEQIADGYLLDPKHAIRDVKFGDHGCELVPGLAELFVLECSLGRDKGRKYHEPMRRLLDGILARAAHPRTGLFCQKEKEDDGESQWLQPADTWGYTLFSYENYDRGTGERRYRAAIEKPLRWLMENRGDYAKHKETRWPRSRSSDDWSDSYESMIVLWNRYPTVGDGFAWLDWATRQHIHRRQPDNKYGPYTGGHFDGSTGRCLAVHMMMCSRGARNDPWQDGVCLGAVQNGDELLLTMNSKSPYRGKLRFDGPRTCYPKTTIDWARINEMPQWFVARPNKTYSISIDSQKPRKVKGRELIEGLAVDVGPGDVRKIRVQLAVD